MGFIIDILKFLTADSDSSYIDSAKLWGDKIWNDTNSSIGGILSLYMMDGKLYKRLRIEFPNKVVGVFVDKDDYGWINYDSFLSKKEREQLKEFGYILIKKY